jgi:hypothetical protein
MYRLSGPAPTAAYFTRRRTILLAALLAVLIFPLFQAQTGQAEQVLPEISGTLTVINDGPGNHVFPKISGRWVTYNNLLSDSYYISYYDLQTGVNQNIDNDGGNNHLADVSGDTLVFTRLGGGKRAIYVAKIGGTFIPSEVDPVTPSVRERGVIGGNTIAWLDFGLNISTQSGAEIVVYDLVTHTKERLTNDLLFDLDLEVSPDGNALAWAKCDPNQTNNCAIWTAVRTSAAWTSHQVTSGGHDRYPSIDQEFIVYSGTAQDSDGDIYWIERSTGIQQRLDLPGRQRRPVVSDGLVVFEHMESSQPDWRLRLYDIRTGTLYSLPQYNDFDRLADIEVSASGSVTIAWSTGFFDWPNDKLDLYALTFPRPPVDRTPPTISITAPVSQVYALNQVVNAEYACADTGTGVASCIGPVANGSPIDTATPGVKTFTVNAVDNAGNTASQTVSYSVASSSTSPTLCLLYDDGKSYKKGSTVPLKLQLCDETGANISSASTVLQAGSLTKVDDTTSGELEPSSSANPDQNFRYDPSLGDGGGYIYNLSTKGLSPGTWTLSFTVSGSQQTYSIQFGLR